MIRARTKRQLEMALDLFPVGLIPIVPLRRYCALVPNDLCRSMGIHPRSQPGDVIDSQGMRVENTDKVEPCRCLLDSLVDQSDPRLLVIDLTLS